MTSLEESPCLFNLFGEQGDQGQGRVCSVQFRLVGQEGTQEPETRVSDGLMLSHKCRLETIDF